MDEDDHWLRQPWEDADPPPRQTSGRPARAPRRCCSRSPGRRTPSARFEAAVAAAPAYVAAGLRARLALLEAAASWRIAARRASARPGAARRQPHRLLHAGGADRAAQAGGAVDERGGRCGRRRRRPLGRPGARLCPAVAPARRARDPAAARHPSTAWRRRSRSSARSSRSDEATRAWLAALPGPAALPGLLATARVMASGLPGMPREHRLELAPPTWRPRSGAFTATDGAARCRSGRRRCRGSRRWRGTGGGEIELGYLDCVAEAAMRGARELDRLLAAARRIAELPGSARSRLPAAAPSPCRSRWSPDACSPVGSMFRRTPVWRAFAIA